MVITYEAHTPYGTKREYRVGRECIWSEYLREDKRQDSLTPSQSTDREPVKVAETTR